MGQKANDNSDSVMRVTRSDPCEPLFKTSIYAFSILYMYYVLLERLRENTHHTYHTQKSGASAHFWGKIRTKTGQNAVKMGEFPSESGASAHFWGKKCVMRRKMLQVTRITLRVTCDACDANDPLFQNFIPKTGNIKRFVFSYKTVFRKGVIRITSGHTYHRAKKAKKNRLLDKARSLSNKGRSNHGISDFSRIPFHTSPARMWALRNPILSRFLTNTRDEAYL